MKSRSLGGQLVVALWLVVAIGMVPLFAAKPGSGTGSRLAVTVNGLRIASDGGGPYVDGTDAAATMSDGEDAAVRQVYFTSTRPLFYDFTLSAACPSGGCTTHPFLPDSNSGLAGTNFQITQCTGVNGNSNIGLSKMQAGESQTCNFRPNLSNVGGAKTTWFLRFQPSDAPDSTWPPDNPTTDPSSVVVDCNEDEVSGSQTRCKRWTVSAADPDDVGRLTKQSKGQRFWAGDYHMSFSMTLERLP